MTHPSTPKICCSPPRNNALERAAPLAASDRRFEAVAIPGGSGLLGTKSPQIPDDGEGPLRKTKVKPFWMGRSVVTRAEFADFVEDTGFVTEAERFGWSFVFWSDVPKAIGPTQAVPGAEWWRRVDGADWRNVCGPLSDVTSGPNDPVTQVSWNDAIAYAQWAGGRLPNEQEWEHAARGGLGDVRFPWGDVEPDDQSTFLCNIWQGRFPDFNTAADGFARVAPAVSFEANGFGLYNMAGNVWEWTSDLYKISSLKKQVKARLATMRGFRLSKGGSYLCHKSYCYRYRIAARSGTSPDSATPHQGFRVIWDHDPNPDQP